MAKQQKISGLQKMCQYQIPALLSGANPALILSDEFAVGVRFGYEQTPARPMTVEDLFKSNNAKLSRFKYLVENGFPKNYAQSSPSRTKRRPASPAQLQSFTRPAYSQAEVYQEAARRRGSSSDSGVIR